MLKIIIVWETGNITVYMQYMNRNQFNLCPRFGSSANIHLAHCAKPTRTLLVGRYLLVLILFFFLCFRKTMAPPSKCCPAQGCGFEAVPRLLTQHWRSLHERDILMFYCPFPRCGHKTPKVQSMRWHWECAHGASKAQSKELKTLPQIVDLVRNRHFRHPGNCQPLLPSGQAPAGSYSLHQKGKVVVRVTRLMTPRPEVPEERRVVRVVTSPSATITAPEDSLPTEEPLSGIPVLPTTLEAVPQVNEEKPTVPTPPKPLQSGTPARGKSSPSSSPQAATYNGERTPSTLPNHTTPPAPDVPATSLKRPEFTPITIPTNSDTDRPWETSPPTSSPAFTVQSTPEYSVGSPMQQGSPRRDPTPSPGAAVIPIPPTPTRL